MALNWVQPDEQVLRERKKLAPLALPGESFSLHAPSIDFELRIPVTTDGGPKRKDDAWGEVWMSSKRLVFLAHTAVTAPTTKLEAQIGGSQDQAGSSNKVGGGLCSKLSSAAGFWVDSLTVDQGAYAPAAVRNIAPTKFPTTTMLKTADTTTMTTTITSDADADAASFVRAGMSHDAPRMPDWLTTSGKASDGKKDDKAIRSFSLPWSHVLSVTFNQPMFSNNHIAIAFHPVADGGLPQSLVPSPTARSTPTPVELKLVFREGRMHEAYKVMEEWRVTAKQRPRRGEDEDVDPLPLYTASDTSSGGGARASASSSQPQ